MKITHVTTRALSTPAGNPLVVGLPEPTDTREFVLLELGTDQGLVGIGLTFFGGALTPAACARGGSPRPASLIGMEPSQVEAIAAKCRRRRGARARRHLRPRAFAVTWPAGTSWARRRAVGLRAAGGGLRDRDAPTYASGAR